MRLFACVRYGKNCANAAEFLTSRRNATVLRILPAVTGRHAKTMSSPTQESRTPNACLQFPSPAARPRAVAWLALGLRVARPSRLRSVAQRTTDLTLVMAKSTEPGKVRIERKRYRRCAFGGSPTLTPAREFPLATDLPSLDHNHDPCTFARNRSSRGHCAIFRLAAPRSARQVA